MAFSSPVQRVTLDSWAWVSRAQRLAKRGASPLWDPRLFPRAPRGRPWPAWHRALSGWLDSQSSGTLQLGTGCSDCGDPTRRVCWALHGALHFLLHMQAELQALWGANNGLSTMETLAADLPPSSLYYAALINQASSAHQPGDAPIWSEEEIQEFCLHDAWETGQEDLPLAYCYCPMSLQESLGCVVVWFHDDTSISAYQVYSGLFFGLPLMVTSFSRFSRLVEALSRRLCRVLVSLYFDDATITNPLRDQANGLSTNYAVWSVPPLQLTRNNLCRALEHSWAWPMTSATSTIQAMSSFGHVLAFMTKPRYYVYCSNNWEVHTLNCVEVVRYCQLLRAGYLRPCWLWWTHGSQSSPGWCHSSADTRDWGMLRGVQAVMRFEPKGDSQYSLCSNQQHRFLAASDAAVEADNPGCGAFHLIPVILTFEFL